MRLERDQESSCSTHRGAGFYRAAYLLSRFVNRDSESADERQLSRSQRVNQRPYRRGIARSLSHPPPREGVTFLLPGDGAVKTIRPGLVERARSIMRSCG